MDLARVMAGANRFVAYVEELTGVIGHADRGYPLRTIVRGFCYRGTQERRAGGRRDGASQSFGAASKHAALCANAPWSNVRVLTKVRVLVLPTSSGTRRSRPSHLERKFVTLGRVVI